MISRIRGLLDVRLAGIALAVEDLEKSIAWWEEVLEFELVSRSRVEAVGEPGIEGHQRSVGHSGAGVSRRG